MTSNIFLPWQTCVKYCNIFAVELVIMEKAGMILIVNPSNDIIYFTNMFFLH